MSISTLCLGFAVPLSLILLYLALPLWATRRLFRGRDLLDRMAYALLLGLVSQALLGTFWHMLIPGHPLLNSWVYVLGWVGVGLGAPSGSFKPSAASLSRKEGVLLGMVFLIGFICRLIHPLETVALGQSDAYTHLYMLRQLVEGGGWAASYPPAFSRILLVPCNVFKIDPYAMARFGGAFFGVGLALSSAWMIRRGSGLSKSALLTACLVCCFPGFNILMKTGVGVFPNQAGLLLIPYLIASIYDLQQSKPVWWLGRWALLGLLLLVPMMLLHLFWIGLLALLLWMMVSGWSCSRTRMLWCGGIAGILICGFALLLFRVPADVLGSLVRVFVSGGQTADGVQGIQQISVGEALRLLAGDYFRIKRIGLGSSVFNAAVVILAGLFIGTCVVGLKKRIPIAVLLGCWGTVTLLQTATGFTQFTAYQREGWSLMLAVAVMGGWLGSLCLKQLPCLNPLVLPVIGVIAVASVFLPPRHVLRNSSSEEEWISLVLWLKNGEALPPADPLYGLTQNIIQKVDRSRPLLVITRPLLQNRMFEAVAGPIPHLAFSDLSIWKNYRERMASAQQVLLLIDPRPESQAGSQGSFSSVSPEAIEMFEEQESRSYQFNQTLINYIQQLDSNAFEIHDFTVDPVIRAYFIRKISQDL